MFVRTARLGPLETLELPEDARLSFPAGLPGFEDYTAFALIEDEYYAPFGWLQALDDPYISFLVVPPHAVAPDYTLELDEDECESLRLDEGVAPRLYCIVTVPQDVHDLTANLKAPVVINPARRRGKQVIRTDERYSMRQPVLQGAADGAMVQSC